MKQTEIRSSRPDKKATNGTVFSLSNPGRPLKERILISVLSGFAFAFTFFFYGVFDNYSGNYVELGFRITDFLLPVILISLGVFFVISAIPILLRGKAYDAVSGILIWSVFIGFIQGNFLNYGINSLAADGLNGGADIVISVIDMLIWVLSFVVITGAVMFLKYRSAVKTAAVFIMILIIGIQIANFTVTSFTTDVFTYNPGKITANDLANNDKDNDQSTIITMRYLNSLSTKKNIIVFLIDRFDVSYYKKIIEKQPDYFDDLDGFTYYNDNVSAYSRTFPTVATMITGNKYDFKKTVAEYFDYTYRNSDFINDLKANNYQIGIYTDYYYGYLDADVFTGVADNVSSTPAYTISYRTALIKNMFMLSLYRYAPIAAKSSLSISSKSFEGIIKHESDYPEYTQDRDADVYELARDHGVNADVDSNLYLFIHLNGSHPPYHLNEDGTYLEEGGNSVKSTMGCFSMIRLYIDAMKKYGVYDDSTIIITGDHCNPGDESVIPTQPRLTALFVKEENKRGELKYSCAQVSTFNFIPTIVKSSGLKTKHDYGTAYSDVPEGVNLSAIIFSREPKAENVH